MATSYLTPGVYVEEVDKGSKPIEGVGTAVAAFLGVAAKGPVGKATMISNWTQFTETFGEFVPGAYLAHAVYGLPECGHREAIKGARLVANPGCHAHHLELKH